MAILKKRGQALLAVASVLAAASCALVQAFVPGDKPFAFSHRVHLAEGLECADCHRKAMDEDDPGMPVLAQCALCHEEIDGKKGPARQVGNLFDGKQYRAARPNRLDAEVLFSHRQHTGKTADCNACHAGIEDNDVIGSRATITMTQCVDCHASVAAPNDCAACHREIRADRPPPSHALGWPRLHGRAVRAQCEDTASQCSLCHTEGSCATCHQEVAPANHNNHFRTRGHGVHARMDRQNCATCHRADSCDACHQQVRPRNHTGMWGAPRDNHCVTCHFPLASTECAACHDDTPSHASASSLPPDHSLAMNCRQCHGLTAPLPHVDNGSECIRCHR